MMNEPDNTAVRTALWRALHIQADAEPHLIEDEIGLKLIAPPQGWQERSDMKYTKRLRASVVARSRFIEDFLVEEIRHGVDQYVVLGAGLDTFAQRRPETASKIRIYEIDRPSTLAWKERRLKETGLGVNEYLHFVPVDFESDSWYERLSAAGFDSGKPAVVSCTGVSLYLTKEAIDSTLNRIAAFAPGSKLAMSFYLPVELLDDEDKQMQMIAEKGAREAGTPMISFFTLDELLTMAGKAGFKDMKTVSTGEMIDRYFVNRYDGLLPASGEVFLLAAT